jgi:hypothetical protein
MYQLRGKVITQKAVFMENQSRFSIIFLSRTKKMMLEDFNTKFGREDIFKLTIGNERLHQDSNYNCVRITNVPT